MSIPFAHNIDLQGNQLENARVQNLTGAPANPVKGQLYFHSVQNKLYIYNGSVWETPLTGVSAHAATHLTGGTDAIGNATSGVDGLMPKEDKTKLDAATAAATNGAIVMRDANGRAKVAAPSAADDIARKSEVDAKPSLGTTSSTAYRGDHGLAAYNHSQAVTGAEHGAVSAATADMIVRRDAAGRARVAAPSHNDDIANKSYVDGILGANDAMVFKGTVGTGGTLTKAAFEALQTYSAGWTYKVITADTIRGKTVEVGDMFVAIVNRSGSGSTNADWAVIQTNIDGAVIGPASSVNNNLASFDGVGGKLIKDSGLSVATAAPPAAQETGAVGTATKLAREDHRHPHATQPVNKGGTGLTSIAKGQMLYSAVAGALATLDTPASPNHFLRSTADNVPQWSQISKDDLSGGGLIPRKKSEFIGNGVLTEITYVHDLGSEAVVVSLWETATKRQVYADVQVINSNSIKVSFAVAPAEESLMLVVIG